MVRPNLVRVRPYHSLLGLSKVERHQILYTIVITDVYNKMEKELEAINKSINGNNEVGYSNRIFRFGLRE